jgi:hypothetical protein
MKRGARRVGSGKRGFYETQRVWLPMGVICGALGIDPQVPRQIAMTPRDKKHRRSPFDVLAHCFPSNSPWPDYPRHHIQWLSEGGAIGRRRTCGNQNYWHAWEGAYAQNPAKLPPQPANRLKSEDRTNNPATAFKPTLSS